MNKTDAIWTSSRLIAYFGVFRFAYFVIDIPFIFFNAIEQSLVSGFHIFFAYFLMELIDFHISVIFLIHIFIVHSEIK